MDNQNWMCEVRKKMVYLQEHLNGRVPWYADRGRYISCREDFWVSGFWAGMLWTMYGMTGLEYFKNAAWDWDIRLEACFVKDNNLHHDVGFQFLPTAVIKYKLTGDEQARRRGLLAAGFLAGRFNPAGNFIRAWNQEKTGWAIIDSTMNLSLLFWAAEEIGDPRFAHIARAHAQTVLTEFIRPDGSVCHIVSFDPFSGKKIESLGGQGYDGNSSWSRGQAWAIYGMANTWRYTKEERFLEAAERVAGYFLDNLEKSGLPCWDFRAPDKEREPLDSSAAAIAACGFLELAEADIKNRNFYREAAEKLLCNLELHCAAPNEDSWEGLLLRGTGNKPAEEQVDVSLIYGDYFYLEALARLEGWDKKVF